MLNGTPKILIADDHPIFRSGVKQILSQGLKQVSISEAPDAREALRLVRNNEWDVVLLDIATLGKNGFQILKDLRSLRPGLPILMLSMDPSDQLALRAIANGASGYLSKDCDPIQLKTAVQKMLEGGRYVSESVAMDLIFNLKSGSDEPLHRRLSDREFQIMLMIAAGKSLSRIAEELVLSVKTVSTYRARLLQKLRMCSNADVIRYAMKERLVI